MLIKPFRVIKLVRMEFWSYIFLTLILGQAAIYLPILLSSINGKDFMIPYQEMLRTGTLYNTVIPLVATSIYSVIYEVFINKTKFFQKFKMFILAVNILVLFFSAFLYADLLTSENLFKQILQGVLYLIGIYIFLLTFLTQFLHLDMETFQEIDDNNVEQIKEKARSRKTDKKGIKL